MHHSDFLRAHDGNMMAANVTTKVQEVDELTALSGDFKDKSSDSRDI